MKINLENIFKEESSYQIDNKIKNQIDFSKYSKPNKNNKLKKSAPILFSIGVALTAIIVFISLFIFNDINDETNLIYEYNGKDGYIVAGISTDCTDVEIPSEYKDLPVVGVKDYAFNNNFNIESMIISGTVINIGNGAFSNCVNLKQVKMEYGTTTIGNEAFYDCYSLMDIKLSETIVDIGANAFYNCGSIISFIAPSKLENIGDQAFYGCNKLIEIYNLSSLQFTVGSTDHGMIAYNAQIIHNTLDEESIFNNTDDFVFYKDEENYYLMQYKGESQYLVLPNDINGFPYSIYPKAFLGNNNIIEISIGDSVVSIGDQAFSGCNSLKSLILPKSVTSIGYNAFSAYLDNLYYEGTIADWCNIDLNESNPGSNANNIFMLDENGKYYKLNEVVIPDTVSVIKRWQFYGFNISKVIIPKSVKEIQYSAFGQCLKLVTVYNLSDLDIKKGDYSHGSIGYYAQEIYTSLEEESMVVTTNDGYVFTCSNQGNFLVDYTGLSPHLVLPNSINGKSYVIGEFAFYQNHYITSLSIPANVLSIEHGAFNECENLTTVTFAEDSKLQKLGSSVFMNCNSLKSIKIPAGITEIKGSTFSGCKSLSKVTFADGSKLKSIASSAFNFCINLETMVIPKNVTNIDSDAFSYCLRLVELYNYSSLPITKNSEYYGNVGYYAKVIHKADDNSHITTTDDGFVFMHDYSDQHYLINYKGIETDIVLPDSYNGNSYILNNNAFCYNTDITSVIIPNTVTEMSEGIFKGCSNLKTVIFEEGSNIKSIPNSVFYNCYSLTNIEIPDSVISIGEYSFNCCFALKSLVIPSNVVSIEKRSFNSCYRLVELYNLSSLPIEYGSEDNGCVGYYAKVIHTSLEEESNIIEIDEFVFIYDNVGYYLVDYIGTNTELILPNDINGNSYNINNYAFYLINITNIKIPVNIKNIGEDAFLGCYSLINVYYGGTLEDWCNITFVTATSNPMYYGINIYMLDQNSEWYKVTEIIIPDTVAIVGKFQFYGFDNVTRVILSDNTLKISKSAFNHCKNIVYVIMPRSIAVIEEYSFTECDSLERVYYGGTKDDWYLIYLSDSSEISRGRLYYYSISEPNIDGYYWYYDDDGNIVIW